MYLVAAMVAIPAGICSSSYQSVTTNFPIISPPQLPDLADAPIEPAPITVPDAKLGQPAESNEARVEDTDVPPFHNHIMRASQTYKVDAALIRAIIMAESSYNPRAVSHRGAQGLMQLMPTTAKWLGVEDSFDPANNIDAGVRYFRKLLDRFDGDVKLALAAYNAGSRYVRKYGGVPPFKATRIYIKKVLKYRQKFQKERSAV